MIVLTWKFELYKVVAGLFSVLLFLWAGADAINVTKNVCLEPGCVLAAADIINAIDEKVDPCTDFYSFACGKWMRTEFIPDDKSSVSQYDKLSDDVRLKLRILLDNPITNETEPFMAKLQHFYKSCMNLEQLEKKGDKPLREALQRVGGWPVVDGNWKPENFDWVEQLIKFRKEGLSNDMIFDLSVRQDYKNRTLRRIMIDQTDLGMPDRQYLIKGIHDPIVRAYLQLAIDAAVLLGANETKAEEELTEAIKLEITLANYSLARENRRNITKINNLYTIEKLKSIAPNTDWLKYFNGLIGVLNVDNSEEVIVTVPEFVITVDKLLAIENKRVLANYMVWRIVLQSISSLDKKYREIYLNYKKILNGLNQQPPRFLTCLSRIEHWMDIGVASLYVKNHFDKEDKKQANILVGYLMKEFKHILKNIDWMDEVTKAKALEKADAFKVWIGYPDELMNDTLVNEYYEKLEIIPDEYFRNVFAHTKFITDKLSLKLREKYKTEWTDHAYSAEVNAFNHVRDNGIEFPAAILQKQFYNSKRPNYLNFGGIGAVIGHEITHAFDDDGMQYDKEGNSVNWWAEDTFKKFKELAQCIIDQYSNFTNEEIGLNLNGAATQGENIADNGGIYEAIGAYRSWVKDNGAEKTLPGLGKYSAEQLFYISFGNTWCENQRKESLKKTFLSDDHAPGRYRVNGVLSNSVDFAKVFNCPVGAKMNPSRRCRVW